MNDLAVLIADGNTEAQAKRSLERGTLVLTVGEALEYLREQRNDLDPRLSYYEEAVEYFDELIEAIHEVFLFLNIPSRIHLHNCSIIKYEGVFYFIEYIL